MSDVVQLPISQIPFPNGAAVVDDAFPLLSANILTGGLEQSEVIYDGGAVRTRPNEYLHAAAGNVVDIKAAAGELETPEVLVARIRTAHYDNQVAAIGIVRRAIAIGEDLRKLQPQIEEGCWVRYLGQHCPFSLSMAYNYMALAENRGVIESELQRVGNGLTLRGALKLITTKKPDPPKEAIAPLSGEPAVEIERENRGGADDSCNGDDDRGGRNNGDRDDRGGEGRARNDVEDYANKVCEHLRGLAVGLLDKFPERLDVVLDHMRRDGDVVVDLARLVQHPKIQAAIAGGPILTALLDAIGVQGVLDAMSEKFGRDLRDRVPKGETHRHTPNLTKFIKTAVKSRSPADQFMALTKFKDALGDDEFEVRIRRAA
jgi:hypothetical protein